ncbi:NRDE family protein [Marinoscillum sp. MHG1-6]|uniref:NRDE family protein n=1 Tax=Marinoscillum sp. MHG1-6 TaxID=2959627 RepID=UPI002157FA23|nr:NRDE family protein [Marinoscillum sp. MHG1-6]
MCLIVFAWDKHPKYKLIVAANRDEFYERPTLQAATWPDHPEIFGGRDQKAMGTWMAISKNGKFGALTNYRDLSNIREDVRSRGEIIPDYLLGDKSPKGFLESLHEYSQDYNGFNFLACDFHNMLHYSNQERKLNTVPAGIHGLSNSLLDTPWPKVSALKKSVQQAIQKDFSHEDLLELLSNENTFDESILPRTGVPIELEIALSAACIRTEQYGTCSSSVLTVDRLGEVTFTEKTYALGGREESLITQTMSITL